MLRALYDVFKAEKRGLGAAAVVFLTSAVCGYFQAGSLFAALKQAGIITELEKLSRSFQGNPNFFYVFATLYVQNLLTSLTMMGLGLFFGVVPFFTLLANGLLLGVILRVTSQQSGMNPLTLLVTQVLPHGVFEIPAALLAGAFGFRLGMAMLRRIVAVTDSEKLEASAAEWREIRKRLPRVVAIVAVLLFAAALVEAGLILQLKS
jgi:stage II sporulation protein M